MALPTQEIMSLCDQYMVANYTRKPVALVRGEDVYIWDADGKRYLDMFPGWACDGIGHCHPRVVAALREQAGTLIHELGHTMSLRKSHKSDPTPGTFWLIDEVAWFSYYSVMNYTFQATLVDYSDEGSGGSSHDHNDWEDVDAAYGLRWSFGTGRSTETGICN